MKNLVRFICLVLALSMLVFSFAACSDEEPSDGDPSGDGTTSEGGSNNGSDIGVIPDDLVTAPKSSRKKKREKQACRFSLFCFS